MKPTHVAIIMDGNRTWAREQGRPDFFGHTEGAKNVKRVLRYAHEQGIEYLTLWALSTENLTNRSEKELAHLFSLFMKLIDYKEECISNGIQVKVIGNIKKLPEKVQRALSELVEETKDGTQMVWTLAVNYGGRDELVRAMQKLVDAGLEEITEERITGALDTAGMPDVDLVIRTGGHQRLSGFMPWQSVYSEFYFTNIKWPAFDEGAFGSALEWFGEQERKHGK